MRIWSIHPKYLDAKGLVALWRETLLAKRVLEGKTQGYINHPQLQRFKQCSETLGAINKYLSVIYEESQKRKYKFDKEKIDWSYNRSLLIAVSSGQVEYEYQHLIKKLKIREPKMLENLPANADLETHPLFYKVPGGIESWEIVK